MKVPRIAQAGKWATLVILMIGGYALTMLVFVVVMNADLYGRLIETQVARGVGSPTESSEAPTVRLVMHRLILEENAVEVSLVLSVDGGSLAGLIRKGEVRLTAITRDGSSYQSYALQRHVTLSSTTAHAQVGVTPLAVQSERFLLPALPSVEGFPFDDVEIRPSITLWRDGEDTNQFRLEVQKALRGRLLHLSDGNPAAIRLTRTPTEKALVLTGSIVFLLLSGILAFALFAAQHGLTTLGELLAVGGYLVAAAGFREVLGVSRAAGTSALEIVTIGLPLLVLASGVAVSFIRGRMHVSRGLRGPKGE